MDLGSLARGSHDGDSHPYGSEAHTSMSFPFDSLCLIYTQGDLFCKWC